MLVDASPRSPESKMQKKLADVFCGAALCASLSGLVAAGLIGAPGVARADEPAARSTKRPDDSGPTLAPLANPPSGDEEVRRYPPTSTRWKLILGGAGLTGVAYGATLASSLIWKDVPGSGAMKIPIAGPWIALGQNKCAPDSPDCGAILYVRGALEILSGIVQVSGLGLVGEGIFMTTEADGDKPKAARPMMMPMPIVTGTTTGLGVVGTF